MIILDTRSDLLRAPDGSLSATAEKLLAAYSGALASRGETAECSVVCPADANPVGTGLPHSLVRMPLDKGKNLVDEILTQSHDGAHQHLNALISDDPTLLGVSAQLNSITYDLRDAVDEKEIEALITRLAEDFRWGCCADRKGNQSTRTIGRSAHTKATDPRLTNLLSQVSETELEATLQQMVAFPTRWSMSPSISDVTSAIHGDFLGRGYSAAEVNYQAFTMSGAGPQRNVLCGNPQSPTGYLLLCAHYDSLSEASATNAPGCDDNASGIAVMLEAARVLQGIGLMRGVVFAAFGGEEQNLFGSKACAAQADSEGWKIDTVFNLDMVGFQSDSANRSIIVEFDQGTANPDNDAAARAFGLQVAQVAADHTDLAVEHSNIYSSDYMPFEALGYPCIGLYDGATDEPFYHKSTDTLDKVDPADLAEVTRLVVGSIITICGLPPV